MNLTEKLIQWQADLIYLQGEIGLVIGALLILIIGLFKVPENVHKITFGVIMLFLLIFWPHAEIALFDGYLIKTHWTEPLVKIFLGASFLLIVFVDDFKEKSAYYFLIVSVLLGAVFLIQARHLLLIYLSMELISFGSYILTNFTFKKTAHEAAIKYLLFGGTSTAIMLFGISFLYGSSQSLLLAHIQIDSQLGQLGFFLFLAGAFFKISLVPFHIWVPNVYQTSPASAAAFFSIVPKIAGFVFLGNALSIWEYSQEAVLVLGMLTIVIGTFGAVRQTNVRRLIAYGAIAHSGFILPLVVLGPDLSMFIWYAVIYAVMNLAAFHFISWFEKHDFYDVDDFGGFGKTHVLSSVSFTGVMISLVGIPPLAGFLAKWFVFIKLWENYLTVTEGSILLTYLIIAVMSTVVGLFYYLKVPFSMFMKSLDGVSEAHANAVTKIMFVFWLVILLAGFLYPGLLTLV